MANSIGNQLQANRQQYAVQDRPNADRLEGKFQAAQSIVAGLAQNSLISNQGALQALQQTFNGRGIDPNNLPRNLGSIAQAARTIIAYGADDRNLSGQMMAVAGGATGKPVTAVDNLRADDGTKLDGVRLANGTILVDSGLKGADLASILVEELGEYAFAQLDRGPSQGDFGAEFAARMAGETDPSVLQALREPNQDDRVMVNGVPGEAGGGGDGRGYTVEYGIGYDRPPASPAENLYARLDGIAEDYGVPHFHGITNRLDWGRDIWYNGPRYDSEADAWAGASRLAIEIMTAYREEFSDDAVEANWIRDGGGFETRVRKEGNKWRAIVHFDASKAESGSPQASQPRSSVSSGGGSGSDRRIKQDIVRLTHLPDLGIDLYAWRYINDDPTRYVGVMAQDLLARPDLAHAVSTAEVGEFAGFYQVDYNALGLTMTTEAEWLAGAAIAEAA